MSRISLKLDNQTTPMKKKLGMVKKVGIVFIKDSFDFLEKGKVIPMDKEIIDDSDSDDDDDDYYYNNNKKIEEENGKAITVVEEESNKNKELLLHKYYDWIVYSLVIILISFIIIGTIVRIFVTNQSEYNNSNPSNHNDEINTILSNNND